MASDRQLAVALKYDPEQMEIPVLAAKGWGETARRIIEAARAGGVPVQSEPDLAEVLARLDLGQEIPQELYDAVARVLAYIYRINQGQAG